MIKYFTFLVGTFFIATLFTSSVLAQAPRPATVPFGTSQKSIVVATVNIENPQIISQEGNTLTISFTITNKEKAQSGVRYGVTLVSESRSQQTVVDEKVFDEVLSLAENSSVTKEVTYTAPAMLDGTYTVLLTSKNESSLPLSSIPAGTVTLVSSSKGLSIVGQSCRTTLSTEKGARRYLPLSKPVVVDDQILYLVCTVVNTGDAAVVLPVIETRAISAYGEKVTTIGGDEASYTTIAANSAHEITVTLPRATKPGTYSASIFLQGLDTISNSTTILYDIPGSTAVIANVTIDKDFYTKDDTAHVSVFWAGSLTSVEGLVTIKNEQGRACAKPLTQPFSINSETLFTELSVPITQTCFNPHVVVTLSHEGSVLDEKAYNFPTTSVDRPVMPWKKSAAILVGLVVIAGASVYIRVRNKNNQNHETVI